VLFDMTIAVGVGMGLAAMLFIHRSIRLTENTKVESGRMNELALPSQISIYDINGPLFFGSAQKALKNITAITPEVRVIVLDMTEVTMVDMSAIVAMESIVANLAAKNVGLVISNLQPRIILKLRRAGVRTRPGRIRFARTMDEAIEKAKQMS